MINKVKITSCITVGFLLAKTGAADVNDSDGEGVRLIFAAVSVSPQCLHLIASS